VQPHQLRRSDIGYVSSMYFRRVPIDVHEWRVNAMTDEQIDQLVWEIDAMAQRIGCRFVPDPDKLMAFRCAQQRERVMREKP
jgi:hypothetical protein